MRKFDFLQRRRFIKDQSPDTMCSSRVMARWGSARSLSREARPCADHPIGRLILLLIEQLSGQNASLAPPLIRLLQHHVIRARGRASSSPAQARSDWSGPRRYERNVQYAWPVRIFIDERGVAAEAWGAIVAVPSPLNAGGRLGWQSQFQQSMATARHWHCDDPEAPVLRCPYTPLNLWIGLDLGAACGNHRRRFCQVTIYRAVANYVCNRDPVARGSLDQFLRVKSSASATLMAKLILC
jgi:hypothetical protein